MFNVLGQINWFAVALATLATAVLGAIWFTALFGRYYILALGRQVAPQTKIAPIYIVGPFVCGFVTCVASAVLLRALGIDTYADGILFGLIVGSGYLATTTVNTGINPNIPHPLLYGAISGSYFLVSGMVISLVIVALG